MQVESFKIFRDLVESQSFSKAATMNFITQSAVSQQIRAMEERFRVPLIERTNKRFGLTREGQALYETSKQVTYHYEGLQHQLEEMRNVVSGTIRVSTVTSIGLHELPPFLKKFLREFPNVKVQVDYRRSNQVYEEILEGTSDLGLVAFPSQKKSIKVEPFRRDRLVVICHPNHSLARSTEVSLVDLANEKFIAFESDIPTRKAVDRIFRDASLEVRTVAEFDNIETVKRAVEIESGLSIVPRATVEQEVKNGSLVAVEFKDKPFYRPLGIIYKSGRVLSPAMKRFLKTLREGVEDEVYEKPAR
ncbi:MAG: LysR family transcriptional regulator [Candidatus Methylacidiphilales bacterium]|nr:LysR family transcriptional regulator [Candidatus Methylacidiphilales bacterium]